MGVVKSYIGRKAYLRPQGFLDASNAAYIITPQDIKNFQARKIKYVSIDFAKIISANINGIKFLNDVFESLYKQEIECSFFNVNKSVYDLSLKLTNRFFNIYESEEVERVFTGDELINKDIYLCCIDNDENRNLIIYHLVKKGYFPVTINSEKEVKNPSNAIVIKDSIVSKFSNRISAVIKHDIVYFYFDGFLDTSVSKKFDIEYFRRCLSIGFKVFVFNMAHVKGMNIHAISFLSKLGVESAEYGALMAVVGLNAKYVQPKMLTDLEVVGYLFFPDEETLMASKELEEAKKHAGSIYKKHKKITKELVQILPYFVNSTISSVEMMTGIEARKEKPELTDIQLDIEHTYIASSLGFYGDIDGMLVLIFSEKLTQRISKILLGEMAKTQEELQDIVAEFANIIVGNTKTEFAKHDIEINLTLPKVFEDIDDLKALVAEKKAIEVKFFFEDDEFYFYLTR